MNRLGFVAVLALAAVVAVSGEPPVRQRNFARGFARQQQAPAGYDYPKPAGYQYPKPDQPFPLPEETPTTTVTPLTTEVPTTAAPVDDYDDSTTLDPESEAVEAQAVAAQLRAARLRQAPRHNRKFARLEQLDAQQQPNRDQQQPNQDQQRPIYLLNLPESAVQRLFPNQAPVVPVAAVPATAAQLQTIAPAAFPAVPQQVYITDYGLIYGKK